jgi:hypothetical protein
VTCEGLRRFYYRFNKGCDWLCRGSALTASFRGVGGTSDKSSAALVDIDEAKVTVMKSYIVDLKVLLVFSAWIWWWPTFVALAGVTIAI